MAAENRDADAPLKLLSLDGGGIRGIASLIILKHLMKQLKPTGPPLKPCEYFDLMGGTSTGGIIAIMLGRLRMDVQTCIEKYIELSSAAFTPKRSKANFLAKWKDIWDVDGKYRTDVLTEKIREVVEQHGAEGDPEAKLFEQNAVCKVFVCATSTARTRSVRLRSYTTADSVDSLSASDCTVWQAARATSAAPTFFDKIKIGGKEFVDGATGANNPVEIVLEEAKSIWPDAIQKGRIQCLVSVGTGMPDLKKFGDNLKEVVETLKNIATETETTETRFYNTHGFLGIDGRYFRFNVDRGLYDVGLDDSGKLGEIEDSAEAYLEAPRVKDLIAGFLNARAPAIKLLDKNEKERYLTWLKTIDNLAQHTEAQKYRGASLDTGRWFLDRPLKKWKDVPKSFMWLNGKGAMVPPFLFTPHDSAINIIPAGSGKTVLVSTIVDKLEKEPESVVVYFYLSFRDEATQDLVALKKSLLMQLVRRLVRRALFNDYYFTQSPHEEWVDSTIAGLLNELRQTFIVIDALDEFPEQAAVSKGDRASIVKFLESICQRSHGGAHVLIASRRLPDIEAAVEDVDLPKTTVLMETELVNNDIKAFLQDSLRKPPFEKWPSNLKRKVAKTLLSKADGAFRWAALQLLGLRGKDRDRDVEIALGELPEDLSNTYKVMLTRIESAGRSEMAMSVLRWLAYSQRPLTLREVSEIAILETHKRDSGSNRDFDVSFQPQNRFANLWMARKVLSGLITVSGIDDQDETTGDRNGIVSFSHFTVQEYLQSGSASPAKFCLGRTAGHWYITRCCLGYISFYDAFYNAHYGDTKPQEISDTTTAGPVQLEVSGPAEDSGSEFDFSDSETEDVEEVDYRPFPLLRYAAKYWWRHAALACSDKTVPSLLDAVSGIAEDSDRLQGKAFQRTVWAALALAKGEPAKEGHRRSHLIVMHKASETANKMLTEAKDADQPDVTAPITACLERLQVQTADYKLRELYDWDSDDALILSAEVGDEVAVQFLVDGGADVNCIQWVQRCKRIGQPGMALHLAVQNNHRRIVKQLLNSSAQINSTDRQGRTPLSRAAELGHTGIARCLIDKGARLDINDMDTSGISLMASRFVPYSTPCCMLPHGYGGPLERPGNGQTCLHWAIQNKHQDVSLLLIEKGAEFLETDRWRSCPLSIALGNGQTALVRAMIEKDKNGCKRAKFCAGWTALHLAAAHRDLAMLRLLIPEVADLSCRDDGHRTALDMAAIGARALARRVGSFPFSSTPERGSAGDAIRFLIQSGCHVDPGGLFSSSPLHQAVLHNQVASVEVLLQSHADADAANVVGWTPLLKAASANAAVVARTLLSHGAAVDKESSDGFTALIVAVANGFVETVQVLLDAGADPERKAKDGKTAFMLASAQGKTDVVRLLESRMPSLSRTLDNNAISGAENDSGADDVDDKSNERSGK